MAERTGWTRTSSQEDGVHCCSVRAGESALAAVMASGRAAPNFEGSAEECFGRIEAALVRSGLRRDHVVAQTIFLKSESDEEACRRTITQFFGNAQPVTTIVFQPPCDDAIFAVEVWATTADVQRVSANTISGTGDGVRWTYSGDILAKEGPVYEQSKTGFSELSRLLKEGGLEFEHVVRTWLYLGNITTAERDKERYRLLNRARADFFQDIAVGKPHLFLDRGDSVGYPASTGIGMLGNSLRISSLSLSSQRPDVRCVSLENPLQRPSYEYDRGYGTLAPKFSRAMAIALGGSCAVLVSGTASITNQLTMHEGDAEKQTHLTLDNIAALISKDNMARHGVSDKDMTLAHMVAARIYVKRRDDFERCRSVCAARLPGVPVVYVVADVCRPDLLVEIEGVAVG